MAADTVKEDECADQDQSVVREKGTAHESENASGLSRGVA